MSKITEALNRAQKEFSQALEDVSQAKETDASPFIKEPLGDLRGLRETDDLGKFWTKLKPVLIFGMILLCIFVFVFGVRQGKRIDELQSVEHEHQPEVQEVSESTDGATIMYALDDAGQPMVFSNGQWVNYESQLILQGDVETNPLQEEELRQAEERANWPYAIQLITYSNLDRAEEEVIRLNQIGFEAFIIASGDLYQVAVNHFENVQSANQFLNSLKSQFLKKYPGAYVRSIKRRS